MEEHLLWRWSTAVQITSAMLVAVFFVVVGRSTGWRGVEWWVAAWVANGVALLVTWVFWVWQPGLVLFKVLLAAYLFSKTAFLLLLLLGTAVFKSPARAPRKLWPLGVALSIYAVVGSLLMGSIDQIGVIQASLLVVCLSVAAAVCFRSRGLGLGWLGVGFALRALLGVIEVAAYGLHLALGDASPPFVGFFLAAHSSFDTGAEWVIALGCVLALTHRTHAELVRSHAELHAAHGSLKQVAERDPLTGLYNRRMLAHLMEHVSPRGARLLFFDLDGFKQINDEHGHEAGDGSLVRFARALERHLPGAHAVIRYAGDEFVAIVPEHSGTALPTWIAKLRDELGRPEPGSRPLFFSVGIAPIETGGNVEHAIRHADSEMYREKLRRRATRA